MRAGTCGRTQVWHRPARTFAIWPRRRRRRHGCRDSLDRRRSSFVAFTLVFRKENLMACEAFKAMASLRLLCCGGCAVRKKIAMEHVVCHKARSLRYAIKGGSEKICTNSHKKSFFVAFFHHPLAIITTISTSYARSRSMVVARLFATRETTVNSLLYRFFSESKGLSALKGTDLANFEDRFWSWTCVHLSLTCVRVRKECSVGKNTASSTLPPGLNAWPPADTRRPATITIPDGQSSAVPPVPLRLRDRVVRGEIVDFAELLPSSLCHQHEQCAITLPPGDGQGANSVQLAVTTQRPAQRSVCDFSAWLEAWTVYVSIMAQHHPDRVSELIGYQHLILDAHQQFNLLRVSSIMIQPSGATWLKTPTPTRTKWTRRYGPQRCFKVSAHPAHSTLKRTVGTAAWCTAPRVPGPFGQARRPNQGGTKLP